MKCFPSARYPKGMNGSRKTNGILWIWRWAMHTFSCVCVNDKAIATQRIIVWLWICGLCSKRAQKVRYWRWSFHRLMQVKWQMEFRYRICLNGFSYFKPLRTDYRSMHLDEQNRFIIGIAVSGTVLHPLYCRWKPLIVDHKLIQ